MELLRAEEVKEVKEEIGGELIIDDDTKQVLQDAHELVVTLFEESGFTGYDIEGYHYYLKDGKVIMVDSSSEGEHNIKVLGKEDTGIVLELIREKFGDQEMNR